MDTYPSTFALVQIHLADDYTYAWGEARANFYQEGYVPVPHFDGVIRETSIGFSYYQSDYLTRRAIPTDVTMKLGGKPVSGQTYEIKTKVCVEPGGAAKTMRIYVVQVLDHWPSYGGYHRTGFKQAARTHGQEDVVTLSPGQCQTITRNFTFDADSWAQQSNIRIIAWAQENKTSSPPTDLAAVHQAAMMSWPFPSLYILGDMNGDDAVTINDVGPFVLALVDPTAYHNQYPMIDAQTVGDTNQNGLFNTLDIPSFVNLVINDQTPPTPNPMTWNVNPNGIPAPISTSAITMTATEAYDPSGVQYYFNATGISAHSSGWQSSRTYTDTGLDTNRSFSYMVRARDLSSQYNTTGYSASVPVATFIETPTGLSVGARTSSSIQVTALDTFTRLTDNLSGLYFEVLNPIGSHVGGSQANVWVQLDPPPLTITATGLTPNTLYRFRVKARNQSGQNETPWYPASGYVEVMTLP